VFLNEFPLQNLSIEVSPTKSQMEDANPVNQPALCRYHWGPHGCRFGDKCHYSHDDERYIEAHELIRCPNDGCTNFCKGAQCRQCHEIMQQAIQAERQAIQAERQAIQAERQAKYEAEQEARRQKRLERESRPLKLCQGVNCQALTTRALCKECHEVNQRYMVYRD